MLIFQADFMAFLLHGALVCYIPVCNEPCVYAKFLFKSWKNVKPFLLKKKQKLSFCGLFANDSVLGDNHSLEELVMTDFRPFHIFLPDCVTKERDCMLGLDVWTDLPLLVGKLLGNQVS